MGTCHIHPTMVSISLTHIRRSYCHDGGHDPSTPKCFRNPKHAPKKKDVFECKKLDMFDMY